VLEGKTRSGGIGDPGRMLELLRILLPTLTRLFRKWHKLLVENLLAPPTPGRSPISSSPPAQDQRSLVLAARPDHIP